MARASARFLPAILPVILPVVLLTCVPAVALAWPFHIVEVARATPGAVRCVALSGNYLAYCIDIPIGTPVSSPQGVATEVWRYDIATGTPLLLATGRWVESLHLNGQGQVVWSDFDGATWRIHLADGVSGVVLAMDSASLWSPRINNLGQVVWRNGAGTGSIARYDLTAGSYRAPLSAGGNVADADLNDAGEVVWVEKNASGVPALFRHDPPTGTTLPLDVAPPPLSAPRLNSLGHVAWARADPGNAGVYLYAPGLYAAGGAVRLAGAEGGDRPGQVSLNDLGDVAWSGADATGRRQLYAVTAASAGVTPVTPWTSTEWDNLLPVVGPGGDLTWVQRSPTADRILLGISDPTLLPAVETCNGRDDDLDGQVDEFVATFYYPDADSDGFGSGASPSVPGCNFPPPGATGVGGDCDDTDPGVSPAATETCNGRDDDCDGFTDEGVTVPTWPDQDGDGYGLDADSQMLCPDTSGRALVATDCNDASAAIHPGAAEVCNQVDDNCNATVDEGVCNTGDNTASGSGGGSGGGAASPVHVALASGSVSVDVWFESVQVAGETSLQAVASTPLPPEPYRFMDGTTAFELRTTADSTARVWVCTGLPGGSEAPPGVQPALLHWADGEWRDVTLDASPDRISGMLPTAANNVRVCGGLPAMPASGAARLATAWWPQPPPAPPAAPIESGGGCTLGATTDAPGAMDAGLLLLPVWALWRTLRRRAGDCPKGGDEDIACNRRADW